jgi:hypothetical protein
VQQQDTVNITSLNLVSDELVITIEQAAKKLEQYVDGQDSAGSALDECIFKIEQVIGVFKLIEMRGAELLSAEILEATRSLSDTALHDNDRILSVITDGFFILPRYLEYVQQTHKAFPVLLVPYINQIRVHLKRPVLAESHFFFVDVNAGKITGSQSSSVTVDEFIPLVRRLRHMFQLGLLSALQDKQVRSAIGMMQRALERLEAISSDRPLGVLFWVGSSALAAMRDEKMELTQNRKILLSGLDRQLKLLQKAGIEGLEAAAPEALIKFLIYIVAMSRGETDKAQQILKAYGVNSLSYTDAVLRSEREALKGPSMNTVSSMATVLKDELRNTKEILENASQMADGMQPDYDVLLETLRKVSEILSVVGLVSASNTLKEELVKIEGWKNSNKPTDAKELIEVADALLYVESTVSGLEQLNLSDEKLSVVNSLARREVIASSQLAEAELLVIQEAESGLALVKRALNSFSESNYDSSHVQNVSATLRAIRGGLIVMHFERAAAVVVSCINFIDTVLIQNDQTVALQQLLETFADAVIGLEYYLDAVKSDKTADSSILSIAEESLEALGFKVES